MGVSYFDPQLPPGTKWNRDFHAPLEALMLKTAEVNFAVVTSETRSWGTLVEVVARAAFGRETGQSLVLFIEGLDDPTEHERRSTVLRLALDLKAAVALDQETGFSLVKELLNRPKPEKEPRPEALSGETEVFVARSIDDLIQAPASAFFASQQGKTWRLEIDLQDPEDDLTRAANVAKAQLTGLGFAVTFT